MNDKLKAENERLKKAWLLCEKENDEIKAENEKLKKQAQSRCEAFDG